jgi:iron(III) transport system substrate-binding protein
MRVVAVLAALALAAGCEGTTTRQPITIYTSIYENVIASLDPVLREAFPDLEIRWFQRGSEDVAARLNGELAAGRVGADLVMTADPFWYEELRRAGHLLPYRSPAAAGVPAAFSDPDGAFATVRMSVMVVAVHAPSLPPPLRPRTYRELAEPAWSRRLTMADPNRSGSAFTTVAALSQRYGWQYFEALRRNEVVAAGGNSAVLNRVMTGEHTAGVVLLENVLQARAQNPEAPVDVVYPEDGVILVPSPIAIMRQTAAPEAARRVYDFFFSDAGQRALVAGWMHSPLDVIPPPAGARPFAELAAAPLLTWTADYVRTITPQRDAIKRRFSSIVLDTR